jgi:hypothetical protein
MENTHNSNNTITYNSLESTTDTDGERKFLDDPRCKKQKDYSDKVELSIYYLFERLFGEAGNITQTDKAQVDNENNLNQNSYMTNSPTAKEDQYITLEKNTETMERSGSKECVFDDQSQRQDPFKDLNDIINGKNSTSNFSQQDKTQEASVQKLYHL